MRHVLRRPSPAMVIALLALFVAIGGTTYAAKKIGTSGLKNNAVTSAKIKNGQVKTADLAANAVTSAKLKNGGVVNADLAPNAVASANIQDGTVGTSDLADGAVTTGKLGDRAVTTAKIGPSAVLSGQIGDNSVQASDVKDGEVVEGDGRVFSAYTTVSNGQTATVLTFQGIGHLNASCAAGVTTTTFVNDSGDVLRVFDSVQFRNTDTINPAIKSPDVDLVHTAASAAANHAQTANLGVGGIEHVVWQVAYKNAAGIHVASADVSALGLLATDCEVIAQGMTTT